MVATFRTLRTLLDYEAVIVPHARREIQRWAGLAATIPDAGLRDFASRSIEIDGANAEAVAALAAVAPRQQRRRAVELLVAYQILVDYVDVLGERGVEQLVCGLRIGMALAAATAAPSAPVRFDPLGDDGGYLSNLVSACRTALWTLPSSGAVARRAHQAAVRCGDALAYTHQGTIDDLHRWAASEPFLPEYEWWEIAAGGNSSIAILALLAAAADPTTTLQDEDAIANAYWPHLCVLSTTLDSLVDYERDTRTGDFSFVSLYPETDAIGTSLTRAARASLDAAHRLHAAHVHTMIVCGIVGYYAAAAAPDSLAAHVTPSVLDELRPAATPIVFALRAQRRLGPVGPAI